MPLLVTSDNTQKIHVTAAPTAPSPIPGAPPVPAAINGPLVVTVTSGTGTVFQDPTLPLEFDVISSSDVGVTLYTVTANASFSTVPALLTDTVTYTVTAGTVIPPGTQATLLNLTGGAPTPKLSVFAPALRLAVGQINPLTGLPARQSPITGVIS